MMVWHITHTYIREHRYLHIYTRTSTSAIFFGFSVSICCFYKFLLLVLGLFGNLLAVLAVKDQALGTSLLRFLLDHHPCHGLVQVVSVYVCVCKCVREGGRVGSECSKVIVSLFFSPTCSI